MKLDSIRLHLRPYSILQRRRTTINHAFAAAIAPCDEYEVESLRKALIVLGQDPDSELRCVYCDGLAETWDHVHATVKGGEFSGAGHRVANLVPCCKPCNSAKGNRSWQTFISQMIKDDVLRETRVRQINSHISSLLLDSVPAENPDYVTYKSIKAKIVTLFQEADELAEKIRSEAKKTVEKSRAP